MMTLGFTHLFLYAVGWQIYPHCTPQFMKENPSNKFWIMLRGVLSTFSTLLNLLLSSSGFCNENHSCTGMQAH